MLQHVFQTPAYFLMLRRHISDAMHLLLCKFRILKSNNLLCCRFFEGMAWTPPYRFCFQCKEYAYMKKGQCSNPYCPCYPGSQQFPEPNVGGSTGRRPPAPTAHSADDGQAGRPWNTGQNAKDRRHQWWKKFQQRRKSKWASEDDSRDWSGEGWEDYEEETSQPTKKHKAEPKAEPQATAKARPAQPSSQAKTATSTKPAPSDKPSSSVPWWWAEDSSGDESEEEEFWTPGVIIEELPPELPWVEKLLELEDGQAVIETENDAAEFASAGLEEVDEPEPEHLMHIPNEPETEPSPMAAPAVPIAPQAADETDEPAVPATGGAPNILTPPAAKAAPEDPRSNDAIAKRRAKAKAEAEARAKVISKSLPGGVLITPPGLSLRPPPPKAAPKAAPATVAAPKIRSSSTRVNTKFVTSVIHEPKAATKAGVARKRPARCSW